MREDSPLATLAAGPLRCGGWRRPAAPPRASALAATGVWGLRHSRNTFLAHTHKQSNRLTSPAPNRACQTTRETLPSTRVFVPSLVGTTSVTNARKRNETEQPRLRVAAGWIRPSHLHPPKGLSLTRAPTVLTDVLVATAANQPPRQAVIAHLPPTCRVQAGNSGRTAACFNCRPVTQLLLHVTNQPSPSTRLYFGLCAWIGRIYATRGFTELSFSKIGLSSFPSRTAMGGI